MESFAIVFAISVLSIIVVFVSSMIYGELQAMNRALLEIAAAITEHPVVAGEAERAVRGEATDSDPSRRGPDRGPSGTPPGMGGPTTGPRDDTIDFMGSTWRERE